MKNKILYLFALLFFVTSNAQLDVTVVKKQKITQNIQDEAATKALVQSSTGLTNWRDWPTTPSYAQTLAVGNRAIIGIGSTQPFTLAMLTQQLVCTANTSFSFSGSVTYPDGGVFLILTQDKVVTIAASSTNKIVSNGTLVDTGTVTLPLHSNSILRKVFSTPNTWTLTFEQSDPNGGGGGGDFLPLAGGTMDSGAAMSFINGASIREGTTNAGDGGNKGVALRCSIDYELKWEAGKLYVMEQDGFTIRHKLYNFTTPDVFDDSTKGFVVGSRWLMDNGDVYACTDDTATSANWVLVSSDVPDLGQVLVKGNNADNFLTLESASYLTQIEQGNIGVKNKTTTAGVSISEQGLDIYTDNESQGVELKTDNVVSGFYFVQFPDYPGGSTQTVVMQADLSAYQPSDSDLTDISSLAPPNDNILQRKAGVWTSRTPAQFKTDLSLVKGDVGLGNADNTSDANKPVSTAVANEYNSASALTFSGPIDLSKKGGSYYAEHTQTGAITFSVSATTVGGLAQVTIIANGNAINVVGGWVNVGGEPVSTTNGTTNYMVIWQTNNKVFYSVKVY